jgi:nucleoside phosphorylase
MIGVVAGMFEEADALFPGQGVAGHEGGIAVRGVDRAGGVTIACAGIGKVAIASAANLLALRHGARWLMVIGTAGSLVPIDGAPRWLSGAIQHDYGAARADGDFAHYHPGAWPMGPEVMTGFAAMPQPDGLGLSETVIASGDCFVECADRAARIRDRLGATLVDMETAAVAQVAALHGLRWCAIKAATDEANADSAEHFHTNLMAAARRSAEAAERALELMWAG